MKHFREPVPVAFSFVMLFAATIGSSRFWQYVAADQGLYYCYFAWLGLLLVILPAWPDGQYRPRWTRWSIIAGPVVATALFWNRRLIDHSSTLTAAAFVAISIPLLLFSVERFRLEPDRHERQQLKWVFLGFGFGMLFMILGLLIPENGGWLPDILAPSARYATFALRRLGVLFIVIGLLLSLMRFRLNDADAVIGRSTGYAALTTALAVVWALGEAFTDNAVKAFAGASNPTLALSISTVVTVAVLAPTKDRMLAWTQTHFQGGLMRLCELPSRLARWHSSDPIELAERALRSIIEGVDPRSAALAWIEADGAVKILAIHNTTREKACKRLADPAVRAMASDLPYRLAAPPGAPPLLLVLGPRGDGASYSRQERSVLDALLDPLSELEQSAFLRFDREQSLISAMDELRDHLRHLHGTASGAAGARL